MEVNVNGVTLIIDVSKYPEVDGKTLTVDVSKYPVVEGVVPATEVSVAFALEIVVSKYNDTAPEAKYSVVVDVRDVASNVVDVVSK